MVSLRSLTYVPAAATILLLILATPAMAHTTLPTPDGKYFVTAGNLNEPVTTFTITGLDLTIRQNESGERGAEVPGQHLNMTATLIAPNGDELTGTLETMHGAVGKYSFEEPYYLTQPGEYNLQLGGHIEENPVDMRILVGSGPIPDAGDLHFPDTVKTNLELQQENQELRDRMTAMEEHMETMMEEDSSSRNNSLPGPAPLFVVLALVGAFIIARRAPRP